MFGLQLHQNRAFSRLALAAAPFLASSGLALAAEGEPKPWQMGLQPPATPIAESIHDFHTLLMWIITIITLFVLVLLIIVVVKFNEKANPKPSRTTHHTHAGSGVDRSSGHDPSGDLGPVVPSAEEADRHSQERHDHQGDRQAVVLDGRIRQGFGRHRASMRSC
jgi:hypothetical protein